MKSILRPSRRTRLQLTLLLVLSLLVQQLALASYVCAMPTMPSSDVAMNAHCQGMSIAADAQQVPPLCTWHCTQQSVSVQSAHSPSVPALPLAAPLPSPPTLLALPSAHTMYASTALWRAPGIPPEFRFRVLLI